jgi:hypothetical protein
MHLFLQLNKCIAYVDHLTLNTVQCKFSSQYNSHQRENFEDLAGSLNIKWLIWICFFNIKYVLNFNKIKVTTWFLSLFEKLNHPNHHLHFKMFYYVQCNIYYLSLNQKIAFKLLVRTHFICSLISLKCFARNWKLE